MRREGLFKMRPLPCGRTGEDSDEYELGARFSCSGLTGHEEDIPAYDRRRGASPASAARRESGGGGRPGMERTLDG